MDKNHFKPHHINATTADFEGNNGVGRYILLPGSDGRAKAIAQYFNNLTVKSHPRGHNLYLGNIISDGKSIEVATIASGMGCSSMEIILHELFHLGGKRFLRIGTAGSLQPKFVKLGDIINVKASVRDEQTSIDYAPIEVPAVASDEFTSAISLAANKLGFSDKLQTGTVHCKSSLYAREFGEGPRSDENKAYMNLISHCGVLASEMETSTLFIQSQLYNYQLMQEGKGSSYHVLSGAILGIISVLQNHFMSTVEETVTEKYLIEIGLESIKILNSISCKTP